MNKSVNEINKKERKSTAIAIVLIMAMKISSIDDMC